MLQQIVRPGKTSLLSFHEYVAILCWDLDNPRSPAQKAVVAVAIGKLFDQLLYQSSSSIPTRQGLRLLNCGSIEVTVTEMSMDSRFSLDQHGDAQTTATVLRYDML